MNIYVTLDIANVTQILPIIYTTKNMTSPAYKKLIHRQPKDSFGSLYEEYIFNIYNMLENLDISKLRLSDKTLLRSSEMHLLYYMQYYIDSPQFITYRHIHPWRSALSEPWPDVAIVPNL